MNKKLVLAAACSTLFSANSFAAEEEKVSVLIQQSTYVYGGIANKIKPDGGDEVSSSDSSTSTMPNDLEIILYFDNYSMYLYPTQEGTSFGVGYFLKEEIEIGGYFGVNRTKIGKAEFSEENVESKDATEFGLFAFYYMKNAIGKATLEFGLDLSYSTEKSEKFADSNGNVEKENFAGTGVTLSVDYVRPIWGSMSMVTGLSYAIASGEEKEGKTKFTSNEWALNLAAIRVEF